MQDELLHVGLEIESSMAAEYVATPDELDAIDRADEAGVADAEEVKAAFAKLRRA